MFRISILVVARLLGFRILKYNFLFLILTIVACANRGFPPGGPKDETPPEILSISVGEDTTGVAVSLDSPVIIEFSEKIDRDDAEKAVELFPIKDRIFYKWKGKSLKVIPREGFQKDLTYHLFIENILKDLRRNSLTETVTYYFTTGDSLAAGKISGSVEKEGAGIAKVLIEAYILPDSLLYWTKSDSAGKYVLNHIPIGNYFLRSFEDIDKDREYKFAVEPVAEQEVNVMLEPLVVNFSLAVVDTSPPILKSIAVVDSMTLRLGFDDKLDRDKGVAKATFQVFSILDSTYIKGDFAAKMDSSKVTDVILGLPKQLNDNWEYELTILGIINKAGLEIYPERGKKRFKFKLPEPPAEQKEEGEDKEE